jgi:hypothetical protein
MTHRETCRTGRLGAAKRGAGAMEEKRGRKRGERRCIWGAAGAGELAATGHGNRRRIEGERIRIRTKIARGRGGEGNSQVLDLLAAVMGALVWKGQLL